LSFCVWRLLCCTLMNDTAAYLPVESLYGCFFTVIG
jgi:hypothetical protein